MFRLLQLTEHPPPLNPPLPRKLLPDQRKKNPPPLEKGLSSSTDQKSPQQQAHNLSIKEPKGNCFICNKPRHWKGDCPETKKQIMQMHSLFTELKEGELEALEIALEQDFSKGL
jgi:hypothetical protein